MKTTTEDTIISSHRNQRVREIRRLLLIVILNEVKNLNTRSDAYKRCFASLNMTFLELPISIKHMKNASNAIVKILNNRKTRLLFPMTNVMCAKIGKFPLPLPILQIFQDILEFSDTVNEDGTRLRTLVRANDAGGFELIHDAAGAVVANAELALNHRGGALARRDYKLGALVEEGVELVQIDRAGTALV